MTIAYSSRKEEEMFLGLRTAIYHVNDIEKGKDWYTKVLGVEPYFDQPFYIGYNVGGYELGLQPRESVPAWSGGAVTYWGVANIEEGMKHALAVGGKPHQEIQDVGD